MGVYIVGAVLAFAFGLPLVGVVLAVLALLALYYD